MDNFNEMLDALIRVRKTLEGFADVADDMDDARGAGYAGPSPTVQGWTLWADQKKVLEDLSELERSEKALRIKCNHLTDTLLAVTSLTPEEKDLVADKKTIEAVKALRKRLGTNLQQAKTILDLYR